MPVRLVRDRALVLKTARLWIVVYGTLHSVVALDPRAPAGLRPNRAPVQSESTPNTLRALRP